MTTRAFTIVAIRLLGLLALFKGVPGVPVMLWVLLQYARSLKAGAPIARMPVLNMALSVILPVIVGLVCLARTKPIAELVTRGADDTPTRPEGGN